MSGLISSNFDSDEVNVLVLLGGNAKWKGSEPEYLKNSCEHGNAVIYEVHPQATTFSSREASALLNEDTLKKVADLSDLPLEVNGKNMGNPALLAGFMDFAYDHYKAEEYSIILWNHGSGVAGVCYDENVRTDNNKNDLLELPELGSAFNSSKLRKDGKKWSFIGMDACLMSSIEVMAVLAQYGNYYIASEETERGGWDYREFPKLLQDNDIEIIGKKIVDDFCEYKSELDQVQTMSLVNLNKILELGDEFEAWAGDMMTYANTDSDWYSKFFAARDEVMEFGWNEDLTTVCQIDLIHFLDLLKQKGISSEHMTNLRNLLSVDGTGAIVYQKSTQETERIHGVTIYFENAKELNEAKYEAYYSDMKIFPTYKNFLNKYVYQNVPKAQGEWKDIIKEIKAGNNNTLRVYFNPEKKQYIKENLLSTKFYLSSKMDLKKETGEVINGGQYLTSQLSYNFATGISEPLVQIWEDIDNTSATDEYEYWIQVNGSDGIPIPTTEEKNKNNNQTFRMVDVKTYSKDANDKYIAQDDAQINFILDEENGTWELDGIDDIDGAYYGYNEDENIFHSITLDADYPYEFYRYKVEGKEGVCYSNEIYSLSDTITLTSKSYSDVWKDRDLMIVVKKLDSSNILDYFEGGSLKELLGGSTEENWTDVISSVELVDNTSLNIRYKDEDTEEKIKNVAFYLYGASMVAENSEDEIETRNYLTGLLAFPVFSDTDNKKEFDVTGYQYATEYQIGMEGSSERIPIETTWIDDEQRSVNVRLNSASGSENAQLIFEKQGESVANEWKLIEIKKANGESIGVSEAGDTTYQYIIQSLQEQGGDVSTWYSKERYGLSSHIVLEEVEYSNVRDGRRLLIECGNSEGKLSCFATETDKLPEFSSGETRMFYMRRFPTASPTPTMTPTPMPTVTPSVLPTVTPDTGATPSPTPTSSIAPTGTPDTEVTPGPTPTASVTPTSIPTGAPEPTAVSSPTEVPTPVATPELTSHPDATMIPASPAA
ncbi:MAG: clostripain-related cysteine peptidase [Suilimivivens sp.]